MYLLIVCAGTRGATELIHRRGLLPRLTPHATEHMRVELVVFWRALMALEAARSVPGWTPATAAAVFP